MTFEIAIIAVGLVLATVWVLYLRAQWATDDEQRRLGVRR